MSRWPPNNPRDRSPPRFNERRPSATYTGLPGQSAHRNSNDPNQIPIDRAPPRGPKAENVRAGYQYGPPVRGRGGSVTRPDGRERDRDLRDARPAPSSYRRDDDRPDWPRRDRDFNSADRGALAGRDNRGYVGRNRSASPGRPRRDSKEAPYSNFSRPSEVLSSYGPSVRGVAVRGRGRGDLDRSRGRNSFVAERERDLFAPRSRSRDGWQERERDRDRPRDADSDRGNRYDGKDLDRSRERDVWPRPPDNRRRDRSPGRSDSGQFGGAALTPTPTGNTSTSDSVYPGAERTGQRAGSDFMRRSSALLTPTHLPKETRKDADTSDYFQSKSDASRRETGLTRSFSPPVIAEPLAFASLDYGPPPSSLQSSNPSNEKPALAKPPVSKSETPTASLTPNLPQAGPKAEASASGQPPFLPPTGPKADRTRGGQPSIVPAPRNTQDLWSKADPHPRTLRPGPAPAIGPGPEQSIKRFDANNDIRNPPSAPTDRNAQPGIPLGPRSAHGARSGFGDVNPPTTPPIAPKGGPGPRPPSGEYRSSIPTGPRAAISQLDTPDYKPYGASRPPSIMGGMNNRMYYNDNRDRQPYPLGPQRPGPSYASQVSKARPFQPSIMNRPTENFDADARRRSENMLGHIAKASDQQHRQSHDDIDRVDLDVSMNASSEDEEGLDEDYFLDSEDKFNREMKSLESKKPLPILKDQATVTLLLRIQLLGMIANGAVPDAFLPLADDLGSSQPAAVVKTGLLSPDRQPDELPEVELAPIDFAPPLGRPLKEPPINPIPTPPIEDLPFLPKNKAPQFQTFEDSDDEVEYEAMSMLVRQEFEKAAWEWRDELDDMRTSFRECFQFWKDDVSDLDLKRELKATTPAPASPALSAAPSITPQLTHERTRGGKNATDLDLQNALRISEQSAREDEERRAREKSKPNYETEAVVPSMLQPEEVDLLRFKDTNQLIDASIVLDKFELVPPIDDFDNEEQRTFVNVYCQYPKKWGKIAESLPGRTFGQCIAHYYLTKEEANYKESFRRAQPKKRRGPKPTQPRSNALLTAMDAEDAENPPMTDSGRPKRAAAPVFGDAGTDADSTPAPQSAKRNAAGARELNGDQGPVRKGRKTGTGTGTKVRRTKAQIAEDQLRAQMQQQLNDTDISLHKGNGTGSRPDRTKALPRGGNLQADSPQGLDFQRPMDMDVPNMPLMPANDFSLPAAIGGSATSIGPQITSYWSVPEQQKFPTLVSFFGKDFAAIADFMKTKSVIMIKNHYQRQLTEGKKELEEAAIKAEEKRYRGDPLGSPPTPIVPPKRRHEATPSMAAGPRPLASALEASIPKTEPLHSTGTLSHIDEFPSNIVQRGARGEIIAKPRSSREIANYNPATPLPQQRTDDEYGSERFPSQQARQSQGGPPRGFFPSDRQELHPAHVQMYSQEQSPPQNPSSRAIDSTQSEAIQHRTSLLNHQNGLSQAHDLHSQHPPLSTLANQLPFQTEAAPQSHRHSLFAHSHQSSLSAIPKMQASHDNHDTQFRRQEQSHRNLPYGLPPGSSPTVTQSQPVPAPRIDLTRPSSTPAIQSREPPRTQPAKRSNIMNILNDDLPEPPQPIKRTSLEAARPLSNPSPPAVQSERQRVYYQGARNIPDEDMNAMIRQQASFDSSHGHTQRLVHQAIAQPAPTDYGSPSSAHLGREQWINRFDPRQPSIAGEPGSGSLHSSPAPGPAVSQYSVAPPPSTQASALSTLHRPHNIDISGRLDQSRVDHSHRRSILGQSNHPGHIPSPPPQQMQLQAHSAAHQPSQPYRSASGSSQHGRVGSIVYNHGQLQQQQQQVQQQQQQPPPPPPPHSHSHSASSHAVSALHQHRNLGSTNFESRISFQQQQQHGIDPNPNSQRQQLVAEQERRHRDLMDMMAHQDQQQQRSAYSGLGSNVQPPTLRTFTPPQGLVHGHGVGMGLGGAVGLFGNLGREREGQGQGQLQGQGQQQGSAGHYRQASQSGSGAPAEETR